MADFRHDGTVVSDREVLKIFVKTPASWSAHAWSTLLGTPSGLAAFLGFVDLSTRLTSCSCSVSVWVLKAGGGKEGSETVAGLLASNRAKKQFGIHSVVGAAFVVGYVL